MVFHYFHLYSHFKLCSDPVKAKANIFFDFCYLFCDVCCLFLIFSLLLGVNRALGSVCYLPFQTTDIKVIISILSS